MRWYVVALFGLLTGCQSATSPPTSPPSTSTAPVSPSYQITTLLTVYPSAEEDALFSRGTTTSERIGQILLGVSDLSGAVGSTNFNNEEGRVQLQDVVNRIRGQFTDADYVFAFDETRANLERFLNDADADGWAIDGRHGPGRDWPFDSNGNDPDGFTAQIVVTVTRLR